MLLTNHVLSGALIGARARGPGRPSRPGWRHTSCSTRSRTGASGAAKRRFLRVAVADGLVSLAVAGALAAASPPARRAAVLAGMAGAALPDLDKPTKLWFGWSPFPRTVDRFHNRIQREAWRRGYVEVLAAAALAPAALIALRGVQGGRLAR